ncbi:TetR/AcrR family transcriptional regulator [Dictyobacter arantiisoli]|uniref:TetR family transcriptional regulator n=1 Tax=Dictyobacter arantiisoli TaxID=2014874 RepID=A0A5A5TIL7_9CHLR|nr:TetR/AcrR family transcriptional regulator [Dictyobacter arantiisoli]GCF11451.1 TetR family transcriptional regulator [Dictyobacter arantiisoli]
MGEQAGDERTTMPQSPEQSKQQERGNRILDVASDLLQRWGYKKTTIDDIARQAGVAKGTIYLHWKTKEDLFLALLVREKIAEGQEVEKALANEPEGATLHNLYKYSVLSALRNPLIHAIMLRNTDMLGDLINTPQMQDNFEPQMAAFNTYIAYLRDQGLIRTDIPLRIQFYMMEAIATGFLTVDEFLPPDYRLGDEVRAELAAETIHRLFEVRQPDKQERQEATAHLKHMTNLTQEFMRKELEHGASNRGH